MYSIEVDIVLVSLVFLVGGFIFAATVSAVALSFAVKRTSEAICDACRGQIHRTSFAAHLIRRIEAPHAH